jgi:hypothetical protein
MQIKSTIQFANGPVRDLIFTDVDDAKELGDRVVQGVHAYCFCDNKLVLVFNGKHGWQPPGGHTENMSLSKKQWSVKCKRRPI